MGGWADRRHCLGMRVEMPAVGAGPRVETRSARTGQACRRSFLKGLLALVR